jgi:hypothetical protein
MLYVSSGSKAMHDSDADFSAYEHLSSVQIRPLPSIFVGTHDMRHSSGLLWGSVNRHYI